MFFFSLFFFFLFSLVFRRPALFVSSRKLNAMPSTFICFVRGASSRVPSLLRARETNDTRNTSIDSGVFGEGKTVRAFFEIYLNPFEMDVPRANDFSVDRYS